MYNTAVWVSPCKPDQPLQSSGELRVFQTLVWTKVDHCRLLRVFGVPSDPQKDWAVSWCRDGAGQNIWFMESICSSIWSSNNINMHALRLCDNYQCACACMCIMHAFCVQLKLNKKDPPGCSIYWNTHSGPQMSSGSPSQHSHDSVLWPPKIVYTSARSCCMKMNKVSPIINSELCCWWTRKIHKACSPYFFADQTRERMRWKLAKMMARWEPAGEAPWESEGSASNVDWNGFT